jgi:hypothetical protein
VKLSDLFVPRWQHSNPEVRKKAIQKMTDVSLLAQISEKDEDAGVREAAESLLVTLKGA